MAEYLSPGVFIQEAPAPQVIEGVSTSTMAILGFTTQGPTDKASLVTSFQQWQKQFGDFTKNSLVPLQVSAFFSNGGRRLYQTRVVPLDAVAAQAKVRSLTTNQQIETGDGTAVTFTKTATTSTLKDNAGVSPIVSSTLALKWRGVGTPVTAQDLQKRDNGAVLAQVNGQAGYAGRINRTSLTGAYTNAVLLDGSLHGVVPGTVTLKWNPDGLGVRSIAIPAGTGDGKIVTTAANGQGSIVTLDHVTGRISVKFAGTDIPGSGATGNLTTDFTPATATQTAAESAGTIIGTSSPNPLTAPGTISVTDGSYSFTTTSGGKPHNKAPILATYSINAWVLNPISKGVWGNDIRVRISGSANFFDAATQTYTRFNVAVDQLNDTGTFDTQETYDELDFTDPDSAIFFPDVMNELSDLVQVAEPGANEPPLQLDGVSRTVVLAGGDELANAQTISSGTVTGNTSASTDALGYVVPHAPVAARSVVISYTDTGGVARTITDDGKGNLTGAVDATYVSSTTIGLETLTGNRFSYATGAFNFRTSQLIKGGTVVLLTYRSSPAETSHAEQLGDTTKSYTVGADGTFDTVNFGRSVFTDPALTADKKGLYSFDAVDEILNVVVPDFAGDATVSGDLLDYAATHAAQPSGGDRFIILTIPKGSSPQDAVDWFRFTLKRYSNYAALYYPWVRMADPLANGRPITVPALGHVAGIYARTDNNRNVGKAPGGTVDGALQSVLSLEYVTSQGERSLLYPNKINALVDSRQTGLAVWGVRTISNDSGWKYIQARRLFMFLEKSIFDATHWIVFENNNATLWARIKAQLTGFLTNLFNQGYFAGTSPAQAFTVKVDETNNDQAAIDLGIVNITVAVAVNKPAEFVVFTLAQQTAA